MKVYGIIPARYGSTRLPGKILVDIAGKPMIQHVYERARQSPSLDRLIVATDDDRIYRRSSNSAGKRLKHPPIIPREPIGPRRPCRSWGLGRTI